MNFHSVNGSELHTFSVFRRWFAIWNPPENADAARNSDCKELKKHPLYSGIILTYVDAVNVIKGFMCDWCVLQQTNDAEDS